MLSEKNQMAHRLSTLSAYYVEEKIKEIKTGQLDKRIYNPGFAITDFGKHQASLTVEKQRQIDLEALERFKTILDSAAVKMKSDIPQDGCRALVMHSVNLASNYEKDMTLSESVRGFLGGLKSYLLEQQPPEVRLSNVEQQLNAVNLEDMKLGIHALNTLIVDERDIKRVKKESKKERHKSSLHFHPVHDAAFIKENMVKSSIGAKRDQQALDEFKIRLENVHNKTKNENISESECRKVIGELIAWTILIEKNAKLSSPVKDRFESARNVMLKAAPSEDRKLKGPGKRK